MVCNPMHGHVWNYTVRAGERQKLYEPLNNLKQLRAKIDQLEGTFSVKLSHKSEKQETDSKMAKCEPKLSKNTV